MLKQKIKIPEGWKEMKIKDICVLGRGRVISHREIQANPGVYLVFSSQSFNNGEMGRLGTYDFDGEYVTWTTDGAYAGTVFYRNGKFNCTNVCGTLKAKDKNVNMKFLSFMLATRTKKWVVKTGNPKLMNNIVAEIPILLPPLVTQNKIAEILGAVDGEIDGVNSVIVKSEKLKESQLNRIFNNKNKTVKLGDCVSHVGSGSTPRGGEKVYLRDGVMFVRSQNVYFDGLRTNDVVYISDETHQQMRRSKVFPNDVLLNITGASIGRACVVPNSFVEANVNQHVCIVRPKEKLLPKFLFYFLQSKIGQNQIMSLQAGGNRQGLNFQQIRSFKIALLSQEEQKISIDILSAFDNKISIYKKIKDNLTQLKKGLMADLLSGVKIL